MARIPADVDHPDRIAFGLTARQLTLLAASAALAWLLASATRLLLPLPAAAGLAIPVLAAGMVVALGQRDGLPLDRLALAAIGQARVPRRRVPAPEGVPAPPAILTATGMQPGPAPAPLTLPAHGIDPDGVVDLGTDGAALICQASTVNFALRTQQEQEALVAALARVLHALTGPVQVVVAAERVEVAGLVAELHQAAGGLPHPALEQCARDHARFLGELAHRRDVLRRTWLLVFRDPAAAGAAIRLARCAEDAAALLATSAVTLTPLDSNAARAVLDRVLDPDTPPHATATVPVAAPDEPVTRRPRRPTC